MHDKDTHDFGRRDHANNRARIAALLALVAGVIALEWTLGQRLEQAEARKLSEHGGNWAISHFKSPSGHVPIPKKTPSQKRVIYVSNSHAMTGGHVAKHLQALLDEVSPDRVEVLDMAEAGIFAPDMLQRTLMALDFQPDLIILAVSYISFSDQMELASQAHSARSFFKNGVFSRLHAAFWLRNYDIGLFTDTFVARYSSLYRYRNSVRDMWEQPLAEHLKALTGANAVAFLEVDESQRWKFPEGYDNNLFQWNLYASGRTGHLGDIQELVDTIKRAGVPLLALNLPIDLEKTVYPYDLEDFADYRSSLRAIFANALQYVDYEEFFPKAFTTYDPMHPTWHGARLHALDIALRLNKHDFLGKRLTAETIENAYVAMDPAISEEYLFHLNGQYPPPERLGFRRYDPSEPANARILLQRLAATPVGSRRERRFLHQLSLRIRYWLAGQFAVPEVNESFSGPWKRAVASEIDKARRRMKYFKNEVVEFQTRRLANLPVPELASIEPKSPANAQGDEASPLVVRRYALPDGDLALALDTKQGRRIAVAVQERGTQAGYQRVDLLGDGSFVLVQPLEQGVHLPDWVMRTHPRARWGI